MCLAVIVPACFQTLLRDVDASLAKGCRSYGGIFECKIDKMLCGADARDPRSMFDSCDAAAQEAKFAEDVVGHGAFFMA